MCVSVCIHVCVRARLRHSPLCRQLCVVYTTHERVCGYTTHEQVALCMGLHARLGAHKDCWIRILDESLVMMVSPPTSPPLPLSPSPRELSLSLSLALVRALSLLFPSPLLSLSHSLALSLSRSHTHGHR